MDKNKFIYSFGKDELCPLGSPLHKSIEDTEKIKIYSVGYTDPQLIEKMKKIFGKWFIEEHSTFNGCAIPRANSRPRVWVKSFCTDPVILVPPSSLIFHELGHIRHWQSVGGFNKFKDYLNFIVNFNSKANKISVDFTETVAWLIGMNIGNSYGVGEFIWRDMKIDAVGNEFLKSTMKIFNTKIKKLIDVREIITMMEDLFFEEVK